MGYSVELAQIMKFGYFDNQNKEYVITQPNTPLPWINYLGSDEYCALMSNTAGGYSFYVDPREQRITRYRYNNIPFDEGGRYIYVRDNKTSEYYSPTWQPVRKKLDFYECRHGMGYTTIYTKFRGFEVKITYFVPLGENLEIWSMDISSLTDRDVSIFSFIEFCLWDAVGDSTNYQRTWNIGQAHCEGSTIIHNTLYGNWKKILAFFSCSEKISGFDTQRKNFLGNFGYNSLMHPEVVTRGKSTNSKAIGWDPIGSHQINLKLKAKKNYNIIFTLGTAKSSKEAKLISAKFLKKAVIEKELKKLKEYWEENLSNFQAETPDHEMNLMLNTWNQYQCMTTFNWSRYASYFESGIGRGMGFRDACQDTLGFCHMIPEKVKQRILELAGIQFERGDAYHQFSPITKKGDLWGYSDDSLWLILAVANYIKETGDASILKLKAPFSPLPQTEAKAMLGHHAYIYEEKSKTSAVKTGTIYEHLKRAIKFSSENIGPHGLPLSGFADWNDCLNMTGPNCKAESVFTAQLLIYACREMLEIAEIAKNKNDKKEFEKIILQMAQKLNKYAWDGAWWRRAFDDSGSPVGSAKNHEARIFLETQPWAVMAGISDQERAQACMDSVHKDLYTKHGILLLQPAFRTYHPELGEISTYPKGLKENGSIFCHPNPWAIIAESILGRGSIAYDYYRAILPSAQNDSAELRKVEPYVYCQMVAGKDHPDFGEGKNSWLTGSAAWNFVAASQYMLGIRPHYDGIIIDPCIPKNWKGYKVTRVFRGTTYIINVKNIYKVHKRVSVIKLDGKRISGNMIPALKDGKTHQVEVIMG